MSDLRIPASRPTLMTPDGDPSSLDTMARTLFATASRYDDFADTARAARPDGSWSGRAFDAYLRATRRAAAEHDTLAETARRVARTCAACSDTLSDLTTEFRRLEAAQVACDARRRQLELDAGSGSEPTAELQRRAAALDGDYAALTADHDLLRHRVDDNEQLLLRAFTGATTLAQILSGVAGTDPAARQAMRLIGAPGPGGTAAQRRGWWARLSDAQREAMIAARPGLVGNTPGLPAAARDQANRIALDEVLAELEQKGRDATSTDAERRQLDHARAARQALRDADAFVDPVTGRPAGGVLWGFDPAAFDGQGSVAVGVGDLDTAADISLHVPGLASDADTIPSLADAAISTYASARAHGDGSSVAGLAWIGYDAPDGALDPSAYHLHRATSGGEALAADLDGLRASRPESHAHLTLIGHSYGSTTVGQALAHRHPDVDDVVLVGSPGVGVDHAAELGVGARHVWVGAGSDDLLTYADQLFGVVGSEGLGADPAGDPFGGVRFQAEDPSRNGTPDIVSHSRYFDDDTESSYNIGRIVDGVTSDVHVAPPRHLEIEPGIDIVVDPEGARPVSGEETGVSDTVRGIAPDRAGR